MCEIKDKDMTVLELATFSFVTTFDCRLPASLNKYWYDWGGYGDPFVKHIHPSDVMDDATCRQLYTLGYLCEWLERKAANDDDEMTHTVIGMLDDLVLTKRFLHKYVNVEMILSRVLDVLSTEPLSVWSAAAERRVQEEEYMQASDTSVTVMYGGKQIVRYEKHQGELLEVQAFSMDDVVSGFLWTSIHDIFLEDDISKHMTTSLEDVEHFVRTKVARYLTGYDILHKVEKIKEEWWMRVV
jgi:hypothetical protein